jgi:hypothetical protein
LLEQHRRIACAHLSHHRSASCASRERTVARLERILRLAQAHPSQRLSATGASREQQMGSPERGLRIALSSFRASRKRTLRIS